MGYDLFVWPIDEPITYEAASQRLEWMLEEGPKESPDPRLTALMRDMQLRYPEAFPSEDDLDLDPDWQPEPGAVIFEMNEEPGCVFLGIPFSCVARVGSAAQEVAGRHDLLILDPQAEAVYLPPRFAGATVDWGTDPTSEELAAEQSSWMAEMPDAALGHDTAGDPGADMAAMARQMAADGVEMWSPMGYQITDETAAEMFEDPTRTPPSLQTRERKAKLLADLGSRKSSTRSSSLAQLAGWNPDPDVAKALRRELGDWDEFHRWAAARGLARQGATEWLDDVLEVVRRSSPAAGGTVSLMLGPLGSALELARLAGSDAVDRVTALATQWRGPIPSKPRRWDRDLDAMLRVTKPDER